MPTTRHRLSPREWEVARRIADGHSVREVAAALQLSTRTVRLVAISAALKLGSRADAKLLAAARFSSEQ